MNVKTGYYQCPLGTIEIKVSDKGIVSINILDENKEESIPDGNILIKDTIQQLKEYFNKQRKVFDLPIDFKGTDFQVAVWQSVYKIPFGKTRTYLDIATEIGTQKMVRAVGAANGKNPLWIVVPCHRVIGADGSLVGYAGGLWRKKWLLEHENANLQLSIF